MIFEYSRRLEAEDFRGNIFDVARRRLLGSCLCSNICGEFTAGRITELEVYAGPEDKACHAYQNKNTVRTRVMFEKGGVAYVFFIYGMYNQFNVVTGEEGVPQAVLIRSLEPIAGIDVMRRRRQKEDLRDLTTGPGKLCQALGITREHNGASLRGSILWISPSEEPLTEDKICASARIGIDYAEEYKDKLWRYTVKDNPFVSK